jgi:hypothetical protein
MMTTENKSELSAEHFDRVIHGASDAMGVESMVRLVGLVVIFRGRQFSVTSEPRTTGTDQRVFVACTTADDGYESVEVWREGSTIMEALEAAMDGVSSIEVAE